MPAKRFFEGLIAAAKLSERIRNASLKSSVCAVAVSDKMIEVNTVPRETAYCERCGSPIVIKTWFAKLCHECSRAEFKEHFESFAS